MAKETTQPAQDSSAPVTKVVKFVKYHPAFAHDEGDTAELLEKDANLLIEAEYAVEVAPEAEEPQD